MRNKGPFFFSPDAFSCLSWLVELVKISTAQTESGLLWSAPFSNISLTPRSQSSSLYFYFKDCLSACVQILLTCLLCRSISAALTVKEIHMFVLSLIFSWSNICMNNVLSLRSSIINEVEFFWCNKRLIYYFVVVFLWSGHDTVAKFLPVVQLFQVNELHKTFPSIDALYLPQIFWDSLKDLYSYFSGLFLVSSEVTDPIKNAKAWSYREYPCIWRCLMMLGEANDHLFFGWPARWKRSIEFDLCPSTQTSEAYFIWLVHCN